MSNPLFQVRPVAPHSSIIEVIIEENNFYFYSNSLIAFIFKKKMYCRKNMISTKEVLKRTDYVKSKFIDKYGIENLCLVSQEKFDRFGKASMLSSMRRIIELIGTIDAIRTEKYLANDLHISLCVE